MKPLTILLSLCFISLLLACKDQSFLNNPDSAVPNPELAASVEQFGTLKVTIKKGGESAANTKELLPQRWDGHSSIQPGIFYVLLSLDEARQAFADDPEMLLHIEELEVRAENRRGQAKNKATQGAVLASFSADVWSEYVPSYMTAKGTTNHTSEYCSKKHHFEVYDSFNSHMLFSQDSTYDSGTKTINWSYVKGCGSVVDWDISAWVKKSCDGGPWSTQASDQCYTYCYHEEAIECD